MPYEELYQQLGYRFKNENLLIQALTRTSAFNIKPELRKNGDFQRLEFIGDKILGQIISDIFFDHYPNWTVGDLTSNVALHVNNQGPLANIACSLELNKLLIMDQGEEFNLVRSNTKVLSDATEALIGAIWIDSGRDYNLLRKIIWQHWNLANELPELKLEEFNSFIDQRYSGTYSTLSDEDFQKEINCLFEKKYDQTLINQMLLYGEYEESTRSILKMVLSKNPSALALNNALVNAILDSNILVLEQLLQHGADANLIYAPSEIKEWHYGGREIYDDYRTISYSVLQIAVQEDSAPYTMVKLLLTQGAEPNWNQGKSIKESRITYPGSITEDRKSLNGLNRFFPFQGRYISIKEALFNLERSNSNEEYLNLNTALHLAVRCYSDNTKGSDLIDILLKAGADPNLRNHRQQTPLDILRGFVNDFEYKNTAMINLLSKVTHSQEIESKSLRL